MAVELVPRMRLLWEQSLLDAIGALVVAAFAMTTAWVVLEGIVELNGWLAAIFSMVTAVAVLETISRRY